VKRLVQNLIELAFNNWSDVLVLALYLDWSREGDPNLEPVEGSDALQAATFVAPKVNASRLEFVLASLAEDGPAISHYSRFLVMAPSSFNLIAQSQSLGPDQWRGFIVWFLMRKMVSNVNRLPMFGLLAPLATAVSAAQTTRYRSSSTGLFQSKSAAVDPAHVVALTGTLVIMLL
jgi:hypothetical protein